MSCIIPNVLVAGSGSGAVNSVARWKTTSEIGDSLNVYIDDNGQMAIGSTIAAAMLEVTCRAANVSGIKITAADSQTADLLKIVDDGENALFIINYKGDTGITIQSPNEPLHVRSDYNGNRAIRMENEDTGTLAVARFIADVNGGSTFFTGYGPGFTTSGSKRALSGSMITNAGMTGGLSVVARHSSTGHVRIYAGGNGDANEHLIVMADGVTRIGDILNSHYMQVGSNGFVTLIGNAKTIRTDTFNFNRSIIIGTGKPTLVTRGLFHGYSLPIYNNDDEELFSCKCVISSWDNVTDPIVYVGGWLDTANNAKRFNIQVSVEKCNMDSNEVVPLTTNNYTVETLTGDVAQYTSYKLAFTIDASTIAFTAGDALAIRIRRLDASSDEIAGEFVVEGAAITYTINEI